MYMCLYVCVCMYVSECVRLLSRYECVSVFVYLSTLCLCAPVRLVRGAGVYMYIHMRVFLRACVFVYVYVYVFICVCLCVYMCMFMWLYVYFFDHVPWFYSRVTFSFEIKF